MKIIAVLLAALLFSGCAGAIVGGLVGGGAVIGCVHYHVWPCSPDQKQPTEEKK